MSTSIPELNRASADYDALVRYADKVHEEHERVVPALEYERDELIGHCLPPLALQWRQAVVVRRLFHL